MLGVENYKISGSSGFMEALRELAAYRGGYPTHGANFLLLCLRPPCFWDPDFRALPTAEVVSRAPVAFIIGGSTNAPVSTFGLTVDEK